ncbi:phage terminase small subunit P27 family [Streptomyces smyrnaeus]|uniref:phage terminase small subunit P27 family n=1 Tax=Streptomyces smyrnaeus TaxID=1387713 RepID=UPI00369FCBF6
MGNTNSGRPRKPAAIKELEGNPGKREIQNEPTPPNGIPNPPEWLEGMALDEWHRLMPILEKMGVVTVADRDAVSAYCVSYETFVKATKELSSSGIVVESYRGGIAKNPALQVQRDALEQMNKWGAKLGLTPADRARLAVAPTDDAGGPDAAVLSLLSGGA